MLKEKFLIADDLQYARKQLGKILRNEGYERIEEAVDGVDAVEKYKIFSPDYVFMDIMMPEIDGVEAVKKILEYDNEAKIIMLTALGQKEVVVKAIEAGAKNFLMKPYSSEAIVKVIESTKLMNNKH